MSGSQTHPKLQVFEECDRVLTPASGHTPRGNIESPKLSRMCVSVLSTLDRFVYPWTSSSPCTLAGYSVLERPKLCSQETTRALLTASRVPNELLQLSSQLTHDVDAPLSKITAASLDDTGYVVDATEVKYNHCRPTNTNTAW